MTCGVNCRYGKACEQKDFNPDDICDGKPCFVKPGYYGQIRPKKEVETLVQNFVATNLSKEDPPNAQKNQACGT